VPGPSSGNYIQRRRQAIPEATPSVPTGHTRFEYTSLVFLNFVHSIIRILQDSVKSFAQKKGRESLLSCSGVRGGSERLHTAQLQRVMRMNGKQRVKTLF
jgi:hypothetical protein